MSVFLGVVLVTIMLVVHARNVAASAQDRNGPADVWAGVYTDEQAARGKQQYIEACGSSHLQDLAGDRVAPALAGDLFRQQWADRSIADLYSRIVNTMPQNAPTSLTIQAYVDIVAFMLQANKFPPGKVELRRDADQMKTILIKADAGGR